VTTMSLTDHDAVAGVPAAVEAAESAGIECVPAVEMSCVHTYSDDLHMLGYWIDLDAIAPACERAQRERVKRAEQIVERLSLIAETGCDGTLLMFPIWEEGLAQFRDKVMPLLEQAGLRKPYVPPSRSAAARS